MKKKLIIIILLLGISETKTDAQIFKAEIISGINFSQVDGDEVYGYKKTGANLGLGVIFPITKNKKWLVSLETIYNQKGATARKTALDTFPQPWKYRLFLDYVEAPIMIHLEDKESWTIGLGFSWGRLVGAKEYENGVRVDSTTPQSSVYAHNDWNILADIRFRIYRGLKFNFRYAYSLIPIRERFFTKTTIIEGPHWRNQYNNMLTFRLIYVINEKKAAKRKTKEAIEED